MSERCMRYLVSGKVQGVFFRAGTCEEAGRLGLRGYARNLRDGRVEVLACGGVEALDALHAWLAVGPPQAEVTELKAEHAEDPGERGFVVR